jgi:hypothetical protein
MIERKCNECGLILPIERFSMKNDPRRGIKYPSSRCKTCHNKKYNLGVKRQGRRNYDYMRKYGITIQDYNNMYNALNGKCEICNTYHKKLFVDHDHKTGKIRGLLCDLCNRGLGFFKDNIESLDNAIRYISIEGR